MERAAVLQKRVFPGWITDGKLTQDVADLRIAAVDKLARFCEHIIRVGYIRSAEVDDDNNTTAVIIRDADGNETRFIKEIK